MTVKRYWVQSAGTDSNAGLSGSAHDAIFDLQIPVTVPAAARLVRLVASCGLSAVDQINVSGPKYGYPMVWRSVISMQEGPSVPFPVGRTVTLNAQAGEYVTSVGVDPAYSGTIGGTTNPATYTAPLRTTNWSAHIENVNHAMSQGSVNDDIGERTVQLEFVTDYFATFAAIPAQISPDARVAYVLRVLYELDV